MQLVLAKSLLVKIIYSPQHRPHLRYSLRHAAIEQDIRNTQHLQLPQNDAVLKLAPRLGAVPAGGGLGRRAGLGQLRKSHGYPTQMEGLGLLPDAPLSYCRAPGATPGTGAGATVLQCLIPYPPTPPAPHPCAARGAPGAAAGSAGGRRRSAGPRRCRCWATPPGRG